MVGGILAASAKQCESGRLICVSDRESVTARALAGYVCGSPFFFSLQMLCVTESLVDRQLLHTPKHRRPSDTHSHTGWPLTKSYKTLPLSGAKHVACLSFSTRLVTFDRCPRLKYGFLLDSFKCPSGT